MQRVIREALLQVLVLGLALLLYHCDAARPDRDGRRIMLLRRVAGAQRGWLWRIPRYAIGGVASYWELERIAVF
jgi:hypothetical protein